LSNIWRTEEEEEDEEEEQEEQEGRWAFHEVCPFLFHSLLICLLNDVISTAEVT
jgi:hypothetical protein